MGFRSLVVLMLVVMGQTAVADKYKDFFKLPSIEYPIDTTEMVSAVGLVDIKLEYPVFQSVAIVGADEISAHWLTLNNAYLKRIGAIGIVIQVESEEQLQILQLYTTIPLLAVSGFSAPEFGGVYPIVVDASSGRVRQ